MHEAEKAVVDGEEGDQEQLGTVIEEADHAATRVERLAQLFQLHPFLITEFGGRIRDALLELGCQADPVRV
ncbi:MAG: hypothetical protein GWO24_14195, partial [Akkermansiaceae bacterium]|nr:hypothetical protein [Akkermansiaceae bacterium]